MDDMKNFNDKRFYKPGGSKPDPDDAEKKKIPIELPDLDMPKTKPEPTGKDIGPEPDPMPPPLSSEPKKVQYPSLGKPPPPAYEEPQPSDTEEDIFAATSGPPKVAKSKAKGPIGLARPAASLIFLIATFVLIGLLAASALLNIFFFQNVSSLKEKMRTDIKAVENIAIEKEKMSIERGSLESSISRLNNDLMAAKNISEGLKREKNQLQARVDDKDKEYNQLEEKIKEYAQEVRAMATKGLGYYSAYQKEKQRAVDLRAQVEKLEGEIGDLRLDISSVDDKNKQIEARYIYDMAFLYAKAGMFDEAIMSFYKFMELNGEDADAHYNLAFIYEGAKGDRDKAIYHYNQYLQLNPTAWDLYEVKMKVASLKRTGQEEKLYEVDLENLKH